MVRMLGLVWVSRLFGAPALPLAGSISISRPPPGEAWPVAPQSDTQKTQKGKVAGFRVS